MTVGQQSCNGTGNRRAHQLRCAEDSDGVLARLVVQAPKIKIRQKERLAWKWICGGNPNNWIELLVPVHLTLWRGHRIQKQGRNWKYVLEITIVQKIQSVFALGDLCYSYPLYFLYIEIHL